MFGRVASIQFTLAMLAIVSASNASVLCSARTVEGAPPATALNASMDIHPAQTASMASIAAAHARASDVPSAPLPPALWPGLTLLLILGTARVAFKARRRTAYR